MMNAIIEKKLTSNIFELPFLNNTYEITITNLHLDDVIRISIYDRCKFNLSKLYYICK